MKIENIDIEATIEKAQILVREDKQLSAATKSMFEILILIITLLVNRSNLNSRNSSKPPSSDPNRNKRPKSKTGKKPGGQKGHVGTTLKKVDDPDKIKVIKVDRRKLPAGQYRQIIKKGEIECPEPVRPKKKGKRSRIKKSKSRNLLERLRDYENDTLRFMENALVPFSNNLGENDIRMTKVQQKISGCFRSMDGAKIFCLVRSYLSTSRKQGIKSSRALELLFNGKLPEFAE
jgi:hypothetical protein